jgi:Zn-dependent protease
MTAAGPGASIALAILFLIIGNYAFQQIDRTDAAPLPLSIQFINVTIFINLFWSFINLCPVLPMDGGQILRDVLGPSRLKLTCIISFITLAILTFGLWTLTQSIFNLLMAFLLGSHTWSVYQQAQRSGS